MREGRKIYTFHEDLPRKPPDFCFARGFSFGCSYKLIVECMKQKEINYVHMDDDTQKINNDKVFLSVSRFNIILRMYRKKYRNRHTH